MQQLTKRERELLHHVWLGRRTAEIARIEGIAVQTVSNRLHEARHKLGGVDRRTAAVLVAEAEGWAPGIKLTPVRNTLSFPPVDPPGVVAEQTGERADRVGTTLEGGDVFVQTLAPERPFPVPRPRRRNEHDAITRISILLMSSAVLLAATFAFLWMYGRS